MTTFKHPPNIKARLSHTTTFANNDLTIGQLIGEGEFGQVVQVTIKQTHHHDHHDASSTPNSDTVMKRLKPNVKKTSVAARDLITETTLLSTLSHSNIVSFKGTVGEMGKDGFGLILERLSMTLDDKMANWKDLSASYRRPQLLRRRRLHKTNMMTVHVDRIATLLEISNAVKHMHDNRVIFRDLKPSNVGFDSEGRAKLFDFGLAKQLVSDDRVDFDMYRLTGSCGSPRYMAPEVQLCLPYGKAADTYSFGILFWEMAALKSPYGKIKNKQQLFLCVVEENKRPSVSSAWCVGRELQELMESCWSAEASKRPSFDLVVEKLQNEVEKVAEENGGLDESNVRRLKQGLACTGGKGSVSSDVDYFGRLEASSDSTATTGSSSGFLP